MSALLCRLGLHRWKLCRWRTSPVPFGIEQGGAYRYCVRGWHV